MELNESLLVVNLVTAVLGLLGFVYAICKIRAIEYFLDHMEDPKKVIMEIMKTKIPIIFDKDGQPILLPEHGIQRTDKNPLVG